MDFEATFIMVNMAQAAPMTPQDFCKIVIKIRESFDDFEATWLIDTLTYRTQEAIARYEAAQS